MMKQLGVYLDKPVIYLNVCKNMETIDLTTVSHSIVMLNVQDEHLAYFEENICEELLSVMPIAILVVGANARYLFDMLLQILSKSNIVKHIMTNIAISDELDALFLSTIPDEGRFDEWKSYMIIDIGDNKYEKATELYIKS